MKQHRPECPECGWEGRYIEQLAATCWMIAGKCEKCGYTDEPDFKDMWRRFEGHGSGSITNDELRLMLKQVRASIPYLESRYPRYTLALNDARRAEQNLEQYARARGMKVKAA